MKLNIDRKLMLGALLLIAARAGVAGTLAGSAHDFSTANWNPGQKVCVTCHTPHNGSTTTTDAPLWNHAVTNTVYTLYSTPTMKATVGQPGGTSKLCLSCHDGTVAIDSFGGTTGSTMISAKNNLGSAALNDDHPIGFIYDTNLATANGSLFDPATKTVTIGASPTKNGTIAATMLFGGKLECSSCHDVHNTFTVGANGTGMVKMASAGSQLCIACHNK
jgi:predicted CXXCH cytochrome family protein